MSIHVNIPSDIERALRNALGGDLENFCWEATLIEGYRRGRLSAAEVGRFLDISDRWEINRWLADRNVPLNYTLDDLEDDRRTLDRTLGKTA